MRRPGRNQAPFAREGFFFGKSGVKESDNVLRFGHAPIADQSAGQLAVAHRNDAHAMLDQTLNVLHGCGVVPHVDVHSRRYKYWATSREVHCAEDVITQSVG